MLRTLAVVALLTGPSLAETAPAPSPSDGLTPFAADDIGMNAAIAEAQRTLPLFLSHVVRADGLFTHGLLKVAFQTFPVDVGAEAIWVTPIRRRPDGWFEGRLDNHPVYLGDWQLGDLVEFPADDIRDWLLDGPDGLLGNFTTRVIAAQPGNAYLWDIPAPVALPEGWE
ncbi:DUF2314 domain-containing protein [Gymnodinialimonas sp.]